MRNISGKNNPCFGLHREQNPNSTGSYVNCSYCEQSIWRSGYDIKHKTNHFCSRNCMHKWQSEKWIGEKSPHYKRYSVECSYCGKERLVTKYCLEHKKNHFCDRECLAKWNSKNLAGKNNPNFGNRLSEKSLQKIRDRTLKQLENHEIGFRDTLPERIVENYLLFNNVLYVKQFRYKLGVADFYLPEENIIIECDGDYWHNLPNYKKRDKKQTEWLEENGYKVVRLWESDIKKDIERCLAWIV